MMTPMFQERVLIQLENDDSGYYLACDDEGLDTKCEISIATAIELREWLSQRIEKL